MNVSSYDQRLDEINVVVAACKVATATQQQRLINPVLEVPVGGFDITVFVSAPGVGAFWLATIVIHQCRVTIGKRLLTRVISHRRAERIRSVPLRDSAKLPKGFLNPLAECLERF